MRANPTIVHSELQDNVDDDADDGVVDDSVVEDDVVDDDVSATNNKFLLNHHQTVSDMSGGRKLRMVGNETPPLLCLGFCVIHQH